MRRPLVQSALRATAASASATPRCPIPSRLPPAAALCARHISTGRPLSAAASPNTPQSLIKLVTQNIQDSHQESGSGETSASNPRSSSWPVREIPTYTPPKAITDRTGPLPFTSDPPNFSNVEWSMHEEFDLQGKPKEQEKPMRLGPSMGRTVHEVGRTDTARALRLLDIHSSRNCVARDFSRHRFHVCPWLLKIGLRLLLLRMLLMFCFSAVARRVRVLLRLCWL